MTASTRADLREKRLAAVYRSMKLEEDLLLTTIAAFSDSIHTRRLPESGLGKAKTAVLRDFYEKAGLEA
jgi:hypothetical protein